MAQHGKKRILHPRRDHVAPEDPAPWRANAMITKLFMAWGLMALCVTVHALGLTCAFQWFHGSSALAVLRFWRQTWRLIRIAGWLILLHLVEISLWALFYLWREGMPDMNAAFYFSAVTYTTVGYGDLVLPREWRLVGGVEALTGILMCGLSTAFFFGAVARMNRACETDTHGK